MPPTCAAPSSAWAPVRIRSYSPFRAAAARIRAVPRPSDPSNAASLASRPSSAPMAISR